MNLIIDNGGTKAIWTLADKTNVVEQFTTNGIYPHHATDEEMLTYISAGKGRLSRPVTEIFFYSTGSKLLSQRLRIAGLFRQVYEHAMNIEADTDLLAAARALCGRKPGIACILGTGSNSCLYDGERILQNAGGLGFILGDEGSGALIGLTVVKAYLNRTLPEDLREPLEAGFGLTFESAIQNVYQRGGPNKYLASFAPFAHKFRSHPFIEAHLREQFQSFFRLSVLHYPNYEQLPVHFLGSIANHFFKELQEAALELGIHIRSLNKDPMPGLVHYHAKKNLPVPLTGRQNALKILHHKKCGT